MRVCRPPPSSVAPVTPARRLPRPPARAPPEEIAPGLDSLAGQPAQALDLRLDGSLPAFVPNAEAAQPAPTSSSSASTTTKQLRSSRPPTRSWSTWVRTGLPIRISRAPGTAPRPARGAPACPSSSRARPSDCQSRLLCNRRAACPRPLAGEIETAIVDAKSGVSGAGRTPKASSHAGSVLGRTSRRTRSVRTARTGDRLQLGFPRVLRAAPAAVCAAACSQRVTYRRAPTCERSSKTRTPRARSYGCCPKASPWSSPGCRAPMPPSSPSSRRRDRHDDRHLRARQSRQGRRRAGGAERESRARPGGDRFGLRLHGVLV